MVPGSFQRDKGNPGLGTHWGIGFAVLLSAGLTGKTFFKFEIRKREYEIYRNKY